MLLGRECCAIAVRAFAEHDDAPAADDFPKRFKVGEIDILGVDRTDRKGMLLQIGDSGGPRLISRRLDPGRSKTLPEKR